MEEKVKIGKCRKCGLIRFCVDGICDVCMAKKPKRKKKRSTRKRCNSGESK